MHKKLILLIAGIVMTFFMTGIARALPYDYEGVISDGVPVSGTIGLYQSYYWAYDGTAGDVIDIELDVTGTYMTPEVHLYFGDDSDTAKERTMRDGRSRWR